MERKYITYYNGIKVDVVEVRADAQHDAQISVLGDPAFNSKPFREYRDTQLEAEGWTCVAKVNGSLFFNEGTQTYANGIEKSMGVVHENDDTSWDANLGFYHNNSVPYIYSQGHIRSIINRSDVRGAITAAFGLVNNGMQDISGARYYYDSVAKKYISEPSRRIYLQKSGRTIIGKKADNTIVFAVCDGVTGTSGLTGYQAYGLAKFLGLRNAVCMDGGGSTYLEYKGVVVNGSARDGANAVGIYIRNKDLSFKVGDKVKIEGVFTIDSIDVNGASLKELGAKVFTQHLTKA